LTLRWPWRSSNASMVWPHSTWPTTVFWPRLCAVDDICGPLSADTWNWWCAADKDRHRHQGLCSRCCYCMEQTIARPSRRQRSSSFSVPTRVPTPTAAADWRANTAVSKAAWWPWPFWPWKWCPSHVWRGLPLCQFWSSYGLSVLELGPMYATDRQIDVRQHHRLMPPPIRGGGIIISN